MKKSECLHSIKSLLSVYPIIGLGTCTQLDEYCDILIKGLYYDEKETQHDFLFLFGDNKIEILYTPYCDAGCCGETIYCGEYNEKKVSLVIKSKIDRQGSDD